MSDTKNEMASLRTQQLRNAAKTVHKWQNEDGAEDFHYCPECTSGRSDGAQCGVCRDGTWTVPIRMGASLSEIEAAFGAERSEAPQSNDATGMGDGPQDGEAFSVKRGSTERATPLPDGEVAQAAQELWDSSTLHGLDLPTVRLVLERFASKGLADSPVTDEDVLTALETFTEVERGTDTFADSLAERRMRAVLAQFLEGRSTLRRQGTSDE